MHVENILGCAAISSQGFEYPNDKIFQWYFWSVCFYKIVGSMKNKKM